eukprot:COSAG01_NODE_37_length_34085_cov_64.376626_19_plen_58_part_00
MFISIVRALIMPLVWQPRAMSRTINRTTANNKRRRMQAVKNVIDSRSKKAISVPLLL